MAKKELENIKIKGHTGTWYEIDRRTLYGKTFYLMESEIYGDEAPGIIIDEAHEPVIEDVFDGFDHETVSTLDWTATYGKNICYDYLKKEGELKCDIPSLGRKSMNANLDRTQRISRISIERNTL